MPYTCFAHSVFLKIYVCCTLCASSTVVLLAVMHGVWLCVIPGCQMQLAHAGVMIAPPPSYSRLLLHDSFIADHCVCFLRPCRL
jgi:hypothetical protein